MFETITTSLLVVLLLLATFFDVKTKHVPNWLTLGTPLLFLVIAFVGGGWPLLLDRLLAGFLLGWLWWIPWRLGMIGGGDQKLFAVIGTATGLSLVLPTALSVAVVGGVQAIATVGLHWVRGEGRFRSFRERLRTTMLPYSFAICGGVVISLIGRWQRWW